MVEFTADRYAIFSNLHVSEQRMPRNNGPRPEERTVKAAQSNVLTPRTTPFVRAGTGRFQRDHTAQNRFGTDRCRSSKNFQAGTNGKAQVRFTASGHAQFTTRDKVRV